MSQMQKPSRAKFRAENRSLAPGDLIRLSILSVRDAHSDERPSLHADFAVGELSSREKNRKNQQFFGGCDQGSKLDFCGEGQRSPGQE